MNFDSEIWFLFVFHLYSIFILFVCFLFDLLSLHFFFISLFDGLSFAFRFCIYLFYPSFPDIFSNIGDGPRLHMLYVCPIISDLTSSTTLYTFWSWYKATFAQQSDVSLVVIALSIISLNIWCNLYYVWRNASIIDCFK